MRTGRMEGQRVTRGKELWGGEDGWLEEGERKEKNKGKGATDLHEGKRDERGKKTEET